MNHCEMEIIIMVNILVEEISTYLKGLIPNSPEILAGIEEYAAINNVPIISLEGARLLQLLVKINKSKTILEVGTAIGYSTAWLASGIIGEGKVTTIELDEERAKIAHENLNKLNLSDKVEILVGDAREIIPKLKEKYDYIFIDAAKGQYNNYLQNSLPLLNQGGILVADNVLFRGMVAQSEINKKYKTLIKGLRQFLKDLYLQPELDTVVLPIGDGISISTKK